MIVYQVTPPLRPPHAELDHPHHEHYRPETDDYPPEEAEIEAMWRKSKGVDTDGKAWLTPRMERNAIKLAERMASWQNMDYEQLWCELISEAREKLGSNIQTFYVGAGREISAHDGMGLERVDVYLAATGNINAIMLWEESI